MSELEDMLRARALAMSNAAHVEYDKATGKQAATERARLDQSERLLRVAKLSREALNLLSDAHVPNLPIAASGIRIADRGWHVYSSAVKGFDELGDATEYDRHTGIDALGRIITFREFRDITDPSGAITPAIFDPEVFRPGINSDILAEFDGPNFQTGMVSLLGGRGAVVISEVKK